MRVKALEARVRRIEGHLKRDPKTWHIDLALNEALEDVLAAQAPDYLQGIDRLVIREWGLTREVLDRV